MYIIRLYSAMDQLYVIKSSIQKQLKYTRALYLYATNNNKITKCIIQWMYDSRAILFDNYLLYNVLDCAKIIALMSYTLILVSCCCCVRSIQQVGMSLACITMMIYAAYIVDSLNPLCSFFEQYFFHLKFELISQ